MKRIIIKLAFMAVASLLLMHCSEDPTGPSVPYLEIYAERTDFRGEAITFTAVFGEGIPDSLIRWEHKGNETYRASRNKKDTILFNDTVKIAWNNIDGDFISTNNSDIVSLKFLNSGYTSNQITISLLNHAPYYDSIKVGSIVIKRYNLEDTVNIIRMALNPSVEETLKVYMNDKDQNDRLTTKFSIDNMVPALSASLGECESTWIFKAPPTESLFTGKLRLSDIKGGNTFYPFQIIVYDEVHSAWIASTHGQISTLNKMDKRGRKLFTLPRFQQVKFLAVVPTNLNYGTEALWVVDRTKRTLGGTSLSLIHI